MPNGAMADDPRFDPSGFYEFNLADGAVRTRRGARVLVLSDDVLAPLVSAAVRNGDLTAVRRLGKEIGRHVAEELDREANELGPETVLGHLSSVLALFGWGRLAFERWGDALVVVARDVPQLDDDDLGVAALLGGALSRLAGRDVACVPAGQGRFVMVDPSIAEELWLAAKEGVETAGLIGRLVSAEEASAS